MKRLKIMALLTAKAIFENQVASERKNDLIEYGYKYAIKNHNKIKNIEEYNDFIRMVNIEEKKLMYPELFTS